MDPRGASFDASLDAAAAVAGRLRAAAKRSGADAAASPSALTVAQALASAIWASEGLRGAVSRLEPVKGGHLGLYFAPSFAAAAPRGSAERSGGGSEAASGAASSEPAQQRSCHTYTISLEPAEFTEERWQVFRKYQVGYARGARGACGARAADPQPLPGRARVLARAPRVAGAQIAVHGDDEGSVTKGGFKRFLVDTPLIPEALGGGAGEGDEGGAADVASSRKRAGASRLPTVDGAADVRRHGYGSFHMLHRVDGELVAVGVVDVLPRCLSSVYLFYDPAWKFLAPGTLSALKEVEWVRTAASAAPQLKWYYLGYYVHGCHKMRYKAQYSPSEMLCHETWRWYPAEECIARLEEGPKCVPPPPPPIGGHTV